MIGGDRLGRYLLIERLGAGAMGEVWLADDPELGRKVAIKVLKDELTIWSERLRREARAMAQLGDPGVVAVYDVGEAGGRVYVAMELIDGDSLRAWLEVARPWRAVVATFVAAGQGLAAAHAAGLVHRDFKPDNVLIARSGRVAVGDFGIARFGAGPDDDAAAAAGALVSGEAETVPGGSDPARTPALGERERAYLRERAILPIADRFLATLTAAGDLIGTPAYMSPEQHQGRGATAASDQFAFCVALWEGLFGKRPFQADPADDLPAAASVGLAIVSGRLAPAPPRPRLPGWLRRALHRGLDGDPARRFPSMDALVAALSAGLARRRRALIGGAAAGVLVSTALVAMTVSRGDTAARPRCELAANHVATVWNPEARARLTTAFAASTRPHAPSTLDRVTAELDRRTGALAGARIAACEATHLRGEQSPAALDRHMACLDRRVDDVGAVVRLLGQSPDAALVDQAVETVASLGDPADCAAAALVEIAPPAPAIAAQVDATRRALAAVRALAAAGKFDDAFTAVEPLAVTARTLAYPPLLAETLVVRGQVLAEKGDAAAGEQAFQEAAVAAAAAGDDVRVAEALIAQLELLNAEGGKPAAALERLGPAEVAVTRAGRPAQRELFLLARGTVSTALARFDDARVDLEAALASRRGRAGATGIEIARAATRLAEALWQLGRNHDALVLDREALALWEGDLGPDHPKVAQVLNNLGIRLESDGQYDEARRVLERALAIKERTLGPSHPSVAFTLNNLALVAGDQGRTDDEAAAHERALAIREQALGPEHPLVASSLSNLAVSRRRQHRLDDAVAMHTRALAIREKVLGPEHPSVAQTLLSLALTLHDLGRPAEALAAAQRARAIRDQVFGPEHALSGWAHGTMAPILRSLRREREACAAYAHTVAVLEKAHGPEHPDLASFLGNHADCLMEAGRAREALVIAERAVTIGERTGRDPLLVAVARYALGRALWDTGGDRHRAIELVAAAHTAYAAGPPTGKSATARMAAWLSTHHAP